MDDRWIITISASGIGIASGILLILLGVAICLVALCSTADRSYHFGGGARELWEAKRRWYQTRYSGQKPIDRPKV